MLIDDAPSYISARSANAIISDSRPTRIQHEALLLLNKLLDELLLLVLRSARSLATDRIKTEGLLRVMHNSLLAKNAVLEAELELRKYNDGKRAEGGRLPLGLSTTSRWDGTAAFPVQSAYQAVSGVLLALLCCDHVRGPHSRHTLPRSCEYDASTTRRWVTEKT